MLPQCKYFMSLYKQRFCQGERAGGGLQGLNLRDLYICEPVRLGGETLVAVPVCDCGPPVRERRLERLPSRVAFVW